MFSNPEMPAHRALHRHPTSLLLLSLAATLLGCTTPLAPSPVDQPSRAATAQTVVLPSPPQPAASCPELGPVNDTTSVLLAYAQQLTAMSAAELAQELSRLGDAADPVEKLQLSLVLSQLHQLPELVRAQELLSRVLTSTDPQAQSVQALAQLLATRYAEQRRLSELLEKQTQQTREVQRRLDQTNERLSALKAIERSLSSRAQPPVSAASAAPASRPPSP